MNATTKIQITLASIKYMARLSEETDCFSATVMVDGKKAFEVSNRGNGGCNDYNPLKGQTYDNCREQVARLEAHCKTLPPYKGRHGDLPMDLDLLIGGLLTDHLRAKDFDKAVKSAIVFLHDGKIWNFKFKSGLKPGQLSDEQRQRVLADLDNRHPGAQVLNWMPHEQALGKWLALQE